MSDYTPAKGDRVRVVIEGEVTFVGAHSDFMVGGVPVVKEAVVSVERLAPKLPTTPGNVVKVGFGGQGAYYLLGRDGRWRRSCNNPVACEPDAFRSSSIEVIYDAGAQS